jgi:hypothetical protein
MMPLPEWLTHPRAVPDLPRRTEIALRDLAR